MADPVSAGFATTTTERSVAARQTRQPSTLVRLPKIVRIRHPMTSQQDQECAVPEAVSVSVAPLGDLPDKLVLTVWANGAQRFVVNRRMAHFLSKAIEDAMEKLSLQLS
jgi:hypothetical protein